MVQALHKFVASAQVCTKMLGESSNGIVQNQSNAGTMLSDVGSNLNEVDLHETSPNM